MRLMMPVKAGCKLILTNCQKEKISIKNYNYVLFEKAQPYKVELSVYL